MKTKIYNQKGEIVGEIELSKEVFAVETNPDLIHQVVVSYQTNQRKPIAHTKDRGEVSGGGRKPWRQKGTGRARHGSIRSPIWRHGGITFGPRKERKYEKQVPKKMRRKALLMVLSEKARQKFLIVLDKLEIKQPKTKEMKKILDNLPCKEKSCLIITPKTEKKIFLASRNLEKVGVIEAPKLNCLSLLSFKYLVLPKESISVIKDTFVK